MEPYVEMDDLGGYPTIFGNTPYKTSSIFWPSGDRGGIAKERFRRGSFVKKLHPPPEV